MTILIVASIICYPAICALCFWLGAHYTYKAFMSDDAFAGFVKYHKFFDNIIAAAERNKRIKKEMMSLGNLPEGEKKINGGY